MLYDTCGMGHQHTSNHFSQRKAGHHVSTGLPEEMNDALKRLMDTQITISEAKWSGFSVSSRTWIDNLGTELHARFAGPLFIITDQFGKDLVPNMYDVKALYLPKFKLLMHDPPQEPNHYFKGVGGWVGVGIKYHVYFAA